MVRWSQFIFTVWLVQGRWKRRFMIDKSPSKAWQVSNSIIDHCFSYSTRALVYKGWCGTVLLLGLLYKRCASYQSIGSHFNFFCPLLLVVTFLFALLIGFTFPALGIDCMWVSDWLACVASAPITCEELFPHSGCRQIAARSPCFVDFFALIPICRWPECGKSFLQACDCGFIL